MIAWNASREAARAVNDALPLLRGADKVKVLALTAQGGLGPHGDLPGADLAAHLAHHDVRAEAEHSVVRDMDVGSALLSAAADFGIRRRTLDPHVVRVVLAMPVAAPCWQDSSS